MEDLSFSSLLVIIGNYSMRTWLLLILVALLAICFTLDPTPTIAEDTTDKIIERQLYNIHFTDNNNNGDKNDQTKNVDARHFCPKCKSHSLSFEGLNIDKVNKFS